MTNQEVFAMVRRFAESISKLMGNETEVIAHNLIDRKVIYLANGYITGRDESYRINDAAVTPFLKYIDDNGDLIGYRSTSDKGSQLKASHFIFKDDEGTPIAMICVNQDTSRIESMIAYLNNSISIKSLGETDSKSDIEENFVQRMTQQAIIEAVEKTKPLNIANKDGKIKLLKILKKQGIFDVKDAIPYVCKTINVSQATLYNYLREIKNEEE